MHVRGAAGTLLALSILMLPFAADAQTGKLDRSKTARALKALPRVAGERPVVAIYEVRSAVPEIQPRAAAEMFMTALVESGAFQVAERVRLNEGVGRERQLMSSGLAAANPAATAPVAGARYIFEVVISENNVGQDKHDNNFSLGGAQLGHKGSSDVIAVDIRITDVMTGLVIDAVDTTAQVQARAKQVSGLGGLAGRLMSRVGAGEVPLGADATLSSSHNDGIDRALRSCIEAGVAELARRLSHAG